MSGIYVSPHQAATYYKVSKNTLRLWANSGKLQYETTHGGHHRYYIPTTTSDDERRSIVYARVSSRKQKDDLQRQIIYLQSKYPNHEVVSDIGSGINYKRHGFKTILAELFRGHINEVVVSTSDRFSRLGASDLFVWIFEQFGARLIFIHDDEQENEDGITEDLMEIITVFTARYYGRRKYKNNTSNKEDQNIPE